MLTAIWTLLEAAAQPVPLATRTRARKPHRAYRRYSGNGDVPEPLKQVVE